MDLLRKFHNFEKFKLIRKVTQRPNLKVLDVGHGFGGDQHKWHKQKVVLYATDPDQDAVKEAQDRAIKSGYIHYDIRVGKLHDAGAPYDIICYNFSLQYIFSSYDEFVATCTTISALLKKGGVFIGIVPDADRILSLPLVWTDKLGNTVERGPSIKGSRIGEMILVKMADGPYYAQGARPEPLCVPETLVRELGHHGMALEEWEPIIVKPTGTISDIYSRFIFRRM